MVDQTVGYGVRLLTIDDFDALVNLQRLVVAGLADPCLYSEVQAEALQEVVTDKGMTLGAFAGERLVGICSLLFPGMREDNLGLDIGLTDEKDLLGVGHVELVMVHPDHRGRALQRTLTTLAIDEARKAQRCRYLCETASPWNYASVKSTLEAGFVVVDLKKKYGGFPRYVFFQSLVCSRPMDCGERKRARSTDISRQKDLLSQGYWGVAAKRREDGLDVLYVKRRCL